MNRLFHGAREAFTAFDPKMIGIGAEPNSVLGVWLSTDPHVAFSYALGGYLKEVGTGPLRLAVARDHYSAIWGAPDLMPCDGEMAYPLFLHARGELSRAGYDGIWFEMPGTDLEGAVCIFDPAILRIARVLHAPLVDELDGLTGALDAVDIDFSCALEDLIAEGRRPLGEIPDEECEESLSMQTSP